MALAVLSIDLKAQLANLEQGLSKAGRLAEKNAAQIERAFSGLKTVGAGVGAALGAALSVAGITAFVRATVDGVDKLNDLSDATGASIENLSALEDIAARTGTSVDTVGAAVIKLNKTLGDAVKPGSDAAKSIAALGLSAAELRKLDPAEAFRQVSVALAGFADDGNKARLVQELFGKSIAEVAPLLKDVAEAGKLNATVTTEQAKAAEEFNKQLAAFQKNVTDAARALTGPLIEALNAFSKEVDNARRSYGGLIEAVLDNTGVSVTGTITERLNETVQRIIAIRKLIEDNQAQGRPSVLSAGLRDELELLEKREKFLRLQQRDQGGGRGAIVPGAEKAPSLPDIVGGDPKKPKVIEPFVIKLDDTTLAALKRLEDSDANKIAALRLELQALVELRPEGGSESSDEALRRVVEELAKIDPAAKAATESKRRLDEILAQTPQGALTDVLTDVQLLNAAFDTGQISVEQWADAIRAVASKLPQELEKPLAEIDEFAQQAARNIQDALGDSVLAAFKGDAEEIEEVWKSTLQRMAAQAAAAQIGKYLFGENYGSSGKIGGALGELFSFISSYGGERAMGGPVQKGRPYLVGERRPEIFVPDSNGRILPDASGMRGGGGPQFVMNVQGDVSENTARYVQSMFAAFAASQR